MKTKLHLPAFSTCASLLLTSAFAAEFTWSGSTGATWNITNTNWSGAPADPWNAANGPGNIARFNLASLNAVVSGSVHTNGINFATAGTLGGTGTINLVGTSPTITTTSAGNINALLAGSAGFNKTGTNTLTLRVANTGLSGTINLQAGRLSAGGATANVALGTEFGTSTVDVTSGAFIRFFQVANTSGTAYTANLILRGTGNGTGALQNDGNATANHLHWNGTIELAENATITAQNSGQFTFNGNISQSGGSRTLSLSLNGGTTTVNAGLTMGAVSQTGNGAVNFGADSVIDVGTWSSTIGTGAVSFGSATVNALGTLTTNRNTNLGKQNQLTASTAVNVQGGTFNLGGFDQQAGVLTQTGGTVSNGTLNASSFALNGGTLSAVPGGSGTISFGGGTLQQSNSTDHSARFSTAAGQQFRIDVAGAANTVTWATDLTSADSTLAKFGAGTLILEGDNSGLSGTLSFGGNGVDAGYVRLADSGVLGGITNVNLGGSQTNGISGIELEGGVAISQSITTAGRQNATTTGYILRNLSGNNTWNGTITITDGGGSYGFISDSGTLTLAGDIESTFVSSFGARGVIFSGAGSFSVTGDLLGGGPNSQNLAVTKTGDGTLTIAGANNTYTGATTVSAGSLLVTGALGDTVVTVGADGTIGGSGSLGGTLTFAGGAKLDLNGATINLTSTNILSVASGKTITLNDFAFSNIIGWNWADAAEGIYTLINGGGSVTLAGSTPTVSNPFAFGNGKSGYFREGSLQVVVIPEPTAAALGGLGLLALLRRRR